VGSPAIRADEDSDDKDKAENSPVLFPLSISAGGLVALDIGEKNVEWIWIWLSLEGSRIHWDSFDGRTDVCGDLRLARFGVLPVDFTKFIIVTWNPCSYS